MTLYSNLNKATHPTALALSLVIDDRGFRVEQYVSGTARDTLIYLMALGQHVCRVIRDHIAEAGSDSEWVQLFGHYEELAEDWNNAQKQT